LEGDGQIVLAVDGEKALELFENEAGGHRWQRVPPTEQNGRRHSSTFTVAVFPESQSSDGFSEDEVRFEATIGHGPGGQHRNKTATAIRATHLPTGETVFIQSERSQQANKQRALEVLRGRVVSAIRNASHGKQNQTRKSQIGSGERSDKIRTVQEQNDRVIDHRTGKKCNVASYLKGEIWRLR
jgi:peptide chain release factor 1